MPISHSARGAYYKAKTKRWLEQRGYQVMDAEIVRWIFKPDGDRIPIKKDQLGSDLVAVSAKNVIFVQCKGGGAVTGGNFPDARRKFAQFRFPPWTRQWVIAWPSGSRVPRIVEMKVTNGQASEDRPEEAAQRIAAGT